MFIATGVWPCWKRAATWRLKAQSILERECVAQNYPDGTNAEQSIWYQQFVVDLLLLPWLQAKRLGNPFTQAYRKRMEATFMFVAAMTDNGGCQGRNKIRPGGGGKLDHLAAGSRL